MKKGLYGVLFASLSAACSPHYAPPSIPPTLSPAIARKSDPKEVQDWLGENLRYEKDPVLHGKKDFWAPCALTVYFGKGDCEDYAICAAAMLEDDAEQRNLIHLYDEEADEAHAVSAYKINGLWGINSNIKSEFHYPVFYSLDSMVKHVFGESYTQYSIYSYEGVNIRDGDQDLRPKMKKLGTYSLK